MVPHPLAAIDFGPYVAWWATIPFLLLLLLWTRLLTWVDKDTRRVMLPRDMVNAGMVAGLLLGLAAFFLFPGLALALGAYVVIFVASFGVYAAIRSKKADFADMQQSLRDEFLGNFGRGSGKDKEEENAAGDFTFTPKSGQSIRQPDAEDPDRAGYDALASLLVDPMLRGAHTVEFAPAGEMIASRYYVDGMPYDGVKIDKAVGGDAVTLIKRCFGGDVDEKRKPQSGKFKMAFAGQKHEVQAKTQGSSAGEAAKLDFDVAARYRYAPTELGFVADQLQFLDDKKNDGGVVIVAMPKGQGLSTLEYALLRNHDAFVSQIITVERHPQLDMEGVTQNKLEENATPEEEAKQVEWVTSQLPGVLLVANPQSRDTAKALVSFADEEHRVYVGLRAGDVFEALEAWRKICGDDNRAMSKLNFVVAGRTFRRLCDETKIPYAPDEKLLKQLGMSSTRVTELYKPNLTGVLRDEKGQEIPDTWCHGLGYSGRFGVYELFNVDDEVRAAVKANSGTQALRQLFRKQKRKYLQEAALARVEIGDTSVQEFLRVFKPAEKSSSTKPPSSSRPKPTA